MTLLEIGNITPTIDLEVQEVVEGKGITDYDKLNNKPSINDVELSGDKSLDELGISPLSDSEILEIINSASDKVVKNGEY